VRKFCTVKTCHFIIIFYFPFPNLPLIIPHYPHIFFSNRLAKLFPCHTSHYYLWGRKGGTSITSTEVTKVTSFTPTQIFSITPFPPTPICQSPPFLQPPFVNHPFPPTPIFYSPPFLQPPFFQMGRWGHRGWGNY